MQKDPQIVAPGVVIGVGDVRKPLTYLVDQSLVLEGIGGQDHPLDQVALFQADPVPGEDHGNKIQLLLFHLVRQAPKDPIEASGLLLVLIELRDRKRIIHGLVLLDLVGTCPVRGPDAAPDDRIGIVQEGGQEGCRHLQVLRIGLQDLFGRLFGEIGELHVVVVVGNGKALVPCAAVRDLQHPVHGVLSLIKAQGPEPCDDLHAVLALCHGPGGPGILQSPSHQGKELCADPVRRLCMEDPGPGGNGPFDPRKADQIMVLYDLQNA